MGWGTELMGLAPHQKREIQRCSPTTTWGKTAGGLLSVLTHVLAERHWHILQPRL